MNVRWWRMGVVFERDGDPFTWTLHVRAFHESGARKLVAERASPLRCAVYACAPSEPLLRARNEECVVAEYGPYRRSWEDPMVRGLRGLLETEGACPEGDP